MVGVRKGVSAVYWFPEMSVIYCMSLDYVTLNAAGTNWMLLGVFWRFFFTACASISVLNHLSCAPAGKQIICQV